MSSFCMCVEREISLVLLVKPPVLWDYGPTLMMSFNLNYLLKVLSLNTVMLEVRVSVYEFWGWGERHPLQPTTLIFTVFESVFIIEMSI